MIGVREIASLVFHLYMVFIVVYSGIAIFALLRYGRTKTLNFLLVVFYVGLISSLYYQALNIINQL
jgi:hypothetical protein